MAVTKKLHVLCMVALILSAGVGWSQGSMNVPLTDLKPAALAGAKIDVQQAANVDGGRPATKIVFAKTGEDRRLIAVEGVAREKPVGPKALVMRYRLTLTKGQPPRAALVVFDKDGGSWYKIGGFELARAGDFSEARLSLTALRRTSFSEGKAETLDWAKFEKAWVGMVADGPAEGALELSAVRLTDEPYKPDKPFRITGAGPGTWSVGQDPAVTSTIGTPAEGPDGLPCMKFEFTVPGGRHMYAIPSTPVAPGELDGYAALRFRYKANIPPGMRLLITLTERGGSPYFCEPPGPWAADWTTLTLPLNAFQWASWGAKDPDGKLDIDEVTSVSTGTHGVANAPGAGSIMVSDLEFIP